MIKTEFETATLWVSDENGQYRAATREEIFHAARMELDAFFRRESEPLENSSAAQSLLRLRLAHYTREIFGALWLDIRHRAIAFSEISHGSIRNATVSTREVLRDALHHNAAACILAHNHPSGIATPSQADRNITSALKQALADIDVVTLDHIIVAADTYSFADNGLLDEDPTAALRLD